MLETKDGADTNLALRYAADLTLLDPDLRNVFQQVECDNATKSYLGKLQRTQPGRAKTLFQQGLRKFLSDYDVSALLKIHPMHLLGRSQFENMIPPERRQTLLDVGAGSGDVTAALAPLFERTLTTETSAGMTRKLEREGYECERLDLSRHAPPESWPDFSVITCFNVLDRCARPLSLLRRLRTMLTTDGNLLVSVPLPVSPHVQHGGYTLDPDELLPAASGWEAGANALALTLRASGWVAIRLSRVPYLSGGDADQVAYELDTAFFVLAPG